MDRYRPITIKGIHSLLCILSFIPYSWTISYGQYTKTNIIQNKCVETLLLQDFIKTRHFHCAAACNAQPDCRRFLFCSVDSTCKLYNAGNNCIIETPVSPDCSCFRKRISCDDNGSCTCALGYYGDKCDQVITDCSDGYLRGMVLNSESYTFIQPLTSSQPLEVICYLNYGGWTGITTRADYCDYEDFNRTLEDYENGFGKTPSNSWLGLTHIKSILENPSGGFRIVIQITRNDYSFCQNYYENFDLGDKSTGYQLITSGGHMDCGDSITGSPNLNGRPFSTYDVDQTGNYSCASTFGAGWWFDASAQCTRSLITGSAIYMGPGVLNFWKDNLNGEYFRRMAIKLFRRP